MKIDFLCQVIDNYGDIAVVWRLVKSLLEEAGEELSLRILVDDLISFRKIVPSVCDEDFQTLVWEYAGRSFSLKIARTQALANLTFYHDEPADVLVEAFGAQTPDCYLDAFRQAAQTKERVILHLEYLTAESWAEEYHLLPSLVPWPGVKKYFFVPGFLPKTGGLIVEEDYWSLVQRSGTLGSVERKAFRERILDRLKLPNTGSDLLITLFSYEHDFSRFWNDLGKWLVQTSQTAQVVVFEGRPFKGAVESFENYIRTEPGQSLAAQGLVRLVPSAFVAQKDYDDLILAGDFHVVRGEESWVRAVLSGRPFLWHAYLQPEGHQKVKAQAFLDVIKPFFGNRDDLFQQMAREFLVFNDRLENSEMDLPQEGYRVFLENLGILEEIGRNFAKEVVENRNLTRKLLDFLRETRI